MPGLYNEDGINERLLEPKRRSRVAVRKTILRYICGDGPMSDYTLRALVGMLESGEATKADLVAVGGEEFAAKVAAWIEK